MHRKNDLPPGSSVGIVLILSTIAAIAWALSAIVGHAGPTVCLSPAQLMQFLQLTGLPFEGVPGGVMVHAQEGSVFYALTDGLYCTTLGSDA